MTKEDKKRGNQQILKDMDLFLDERAYKTFEIFYRFKSARLIGDFEKAIALYERDPSLTKQLFEKWIEIDRKNRTKDQDDSSASAYVELEHRSINETYAAEIGSENPHAWQFVKFNDLDAIAQDVHKFKQAILRYSLKKGLNQKALAAKLEISSQAMSQFFKSDKMPRLTTLNKIETALSVEGVYIHHPEVENQDE